VEIGQARRAVIAPNPNILREIAIGIESAY
jgi:hypothetical protein